MYERAYIPIQKLRHIYASVSLFTPKSKLPCHGALAAGLALGALLGPVVRAGQEVVRRRGQPAEIAAAVHHHHRPAAIGRIVGAEAELAAGLELRCDQIERPVVDQDRKSTRLNSSH